MKECNILVIGSPITYSFIDLELLKANNIKPFFSFKYGADLIKDEKCCYYESLTLDNIGKIIENNPIDAIVCYNDNFIIETAQLRTKYNIKGIKYPEVEKYKIKSKMYEALGKNFLVPKTINYFSKLSFNQITKILDQKDFFIKPENLAGSEGSHHIKSESSYTYWKTKLYSIKNSYIIQKYYALPLVHCELLIENGNIRYIQARNYSYPNHMFLSGKTIASFPITDHSLKQQIEKTSIDIAKLLNYSHGVMHTEFFLTADKQLIFLETNIRQAGGAINLIHAKQAGISFETAMIFLELNKNFIINVQEHPYLMGGYIPIKCGKVIKKTIPKLKGDYNFDFRVTIGQKCSQPVSTSNVAASFFGSNSSYQDLIDDFKIIENHDIIEYL